LDPKVSWACAFVGWRGTGGGFGAAWFGADNADEADDDEAFVPGTTAEADGEDSDGYWWWQSTEVRATKWVVPQWEVLAAGRVGWDGGLKEVRVNESRGNSGEQE
jgi:hypothetical protein